VSGGIAPPFLTSTLGGGEWSASPPGRFILGEFAPDTHWIGGWVVPRAGLDAVEKIIILPCQEFNPCLRRIVGPKIEEVKESCTKLNNKELHNLYFSLNIIM
jgi:hypothetical protein